MTPQDFVEAKFIEYDVDPFILTKPELADLITEFEQIKGHIKENEWQTKLEPERPVQAWEWIAYNQNYNEWRARYEGKMNTMDAGMTKPNPPRYVRANND